ncbi:hypothetical protein, partial [Aeromonas salmonicida]|uniref:hypothetical protein n=1 Tax=Aeromonas salmonicida TaxID=645 RepID=UPI00223FC695
WRNGFAHDVMVPSWRDQARGNSGSRDDRLTFSCQCHLGEQLPSSWGSMAIASSGMIDWWI